ncbi:hypothetical protein ACN6MY_17805 [Peribacillus sp. B-H-3]|uniref:hypothetical protein n=1 Tax=Peribacillus sp. B-H-3 TaxID=3400420 RepID=UPI003B023371
MNDLEYRSIELENDFFRAIVLPGEGSNIADMAENLMTGTSSPAYESMMEIFS